MHTHTHAMAGRDPDGDGDGAPAPPAQRARPDDDLPAAPVFVCGLEVGLLDVGRVVALNGYPEACKRLAFVSSSFYLERDLLMATKWVRYGGKQRTRLMSLSRAGDVERVSFLLKVGADMGARDGRGLTPLHWASERGHEPVVRLLLDRGADVGVRTTTGWTALHIASRKGREPVVRLLLDKGADVGARTTTHGSTSLHSASQAGHEPVVRLLLDRGADAAAKDMFGRTALTLRGRSGAADPTRLLLEEAGRKG
jgi:ankyrin repeat protein